MAKITKSKKRLLAGGVVTLAMAALILWGQSNWREAVRLRGQMASMVNKETLDSAQGRVADLEKTVARLESQLAPEKHSEETPEELLQPDEPGKALLEMFAALSGGEQGEGAETGQKNPLLEMFSGEGGKKLADYAARMSMDMAFGEFFEEVNLGSETEQQVRDILATHMSDQMTKGIEAMKTGLDGEKLQEMEEDVEKRLREELSRVLTPQEMALWDEYEATLEERMLAQNLDMQLNIFAGGMTPENRELARDVLVDEMLAIGEERGQGTGMSMGMDMDMQGAFDTQREAFERARERLAGELDDEQLTYYDRFVEAQEQAFEMAAELFGGLTGQTEESEQQ